MASFILLFFLKILFIYFLKREKGREKERVRNVNVLEKHWSVASCTPPTRDMACNPDICPDVELNQWSSGLQDDAQPHWVTPVRSQQLALNQSFITFFGPWPTLGNTFVLWPSTHSIYFSKNHIKSLMKQHLPLRCVMHSDIFYSVLFNILKSTELIS